MSDSSIQVCVLRLFNGPLRGCEFILDRPGTLFVVSNPALLDDQQRPSVPADAIFVPLEEGGCNFEVLLTDNSLSGCVIRELGENACEQPLAFQTLRQVGALSIAVRPQDQPWEPLLLASAAENDSATAALKSAHLKRPWLAPLLAGVLVCMGVAGAWYGLRDTSVSTVEKLVNGSANALQVVHGRDRGVYVFASSERDLHWARQVLTRNGHSAEQVLTPYLERLRLQQVLAEHMPQLAYHRIDFGNVSHPRIWLSNQRNRINPAFERDLEALLLKATPYATTFSVHSADDQALTHRAEQALARLAVPYERLQRADSVTFSIQGSLQDAELSAVRALVNDFYRQWGDRYVHFAVELKDDWLKGKSFQYGPQGYIKTTPSSWYFPKPN
jgi:type III secretion system PrgH/EprH family protein